MYFILPSLVLYLGVGISIGLGTSYQGRWKSYFHELFNEGHKYSLNSNKLKLEGGIKITSSAKEFKNLM